MSALYAAEPAVLYQARELLLGRGLAVLVAWALLTLLVSGYRVTRADRRTEGFHFHGMNVAWGLINAGLAFGGIWQLLPAAPAGLQLPGLFAQQLHHETLFAVNTGLDAAYLMTGLYLRARAAAPGTARPERLRGYGLSLRVQGGFLFVFDAAMWALLHGQSGAWLTAAGAR